MSYEGYTEVGSVTPGSGGKYTIKQGYSAPRCTQNRSSPCSRRPVLLTGRGKAWLRGPHEDDPRIC